MYIRQMSEKAPKLRINLNHPTPAYRQIVDGLRTFLVNGKLRSGDLLPPVRDRSMRLPRM